MHIFVALDTAATATTGVVVISKRVLKCFVGDTTTTASTESTAVGRRVESGEGVRVCVTCCVKGMIWIWFYVHDDDVLIIQRGCNDITCCC